MNKEISIEFSHGLGDCVMFAHMIPLYIRRGYNVGVYCVNGLEKNVLFQAAGARILDEPCHKHSWEFPPGGPPLFDDLLSRNKACWNITKAPLPHIGNRKELIEEYLNVRLDLMPFLSEERKAYVDKMIEDLPRPLILVHTTGNSCAENKNISELEVRNLYRGLIDKTNGTILLLDWDQRVPKLHSYRVRHLGDDFRNLYVPELFYLIKQSDLLIGVDSGPLHMARCTETKAIGWSFKHHPSECELPRHNTLWMCPFWYKDQNKLYRMWYNIIEARGRTEEHWPEGDGVYPDGNYMAEVAAQLVNPPKWLPAKWHVRDVQLRQLLEWTRHPSANATEYHDRHRTFSMILDHLAAIKNPRVIETGCIRAEEDWGGAGYSTFWLGMALEAMDGHLDSVDCTPEHVEFARKWTAWFGDGVTVHQADSQAWLAAYNGPLIDVFYADSADVGTSQFEEVCLGEIQRAVEILKPDGLILIDDMLYHQGKWSGKGRQAIPWLLSQGWEVVYGGYQVLLQRNKA